MRRLALEQGALLLVPKTTPDVHCKLLTQVAEAALSTCKILTFNCHEVYFFTLLVHGQLAEAGL